jgi:hypothetical protein
VSSDDAFTHGERFRGQTETLGGVVDQQGALLRAGEPDRGAAVLDRLAAG